MKWTLIALALLVALFGVYYLYFVSVTNDKVVTELRAEPHGERAAKVLILTLPEGRQIPVNYLREGNTVYVGADGRWWREFTGAGAPVKLEIRGEALTGRAVAILDDPERVEAVFARLRPTVPEWLPDWLNGKLVEITLGSL